MMASKVEPGSVPSVDQQKCPLKLISSRRGKKVVILDGYIFHLNTKNKNTAYFKCSQRTKGCNASVLLRNWNHTNFTFDGYEITNSIHVNHLPDPDKIRKKEEKVNKVQAEKTQDLKAPEFLNSKHVCLFCLSSLPVNYLQTSVLENVVPYGNDLTILLDNPTKNSQAFDLLCSLLNVKWRRYHEGRTFDQTITLPLCIKCQNLYQEVFQLHVQIRELEVLINKRIKIIRGLVERTGENDSIGQTQLALLGLDNFRKKVKDANFNKYGCDAEDSDNLPSTPPKVNIATTANTKIEPQVDTASASVDIPTPSPLSANREQTIVKQEVIPEEENLEDYYYEPEPSWVHGGEEDVNDSEDIPSSPKRMVTPQRTRSTRLAAQRASERVAAAEKFDDGDDKSERDSDSDAKINEDDDDDSFDGDSDTEFTAPTPKKKVNTSRSYVSSLSRSIRYRQHKSTSSNKSSREFKSTRKYTCNICSAVSIGHSSFVDHFKKEHPGKKRFACKFCDRKFESFRNVSIHQRTHTGEKPFKCPHCSFATHHPKTLPSHIVHMHSDRPPETFKCPECPKGFPTRSTLNNHLIASHGKEHDQKFYRKSGKPVKTITCHLCDTPVVGQGPFAQHYAEVHPEEKKYTCKYCKTHFRYIREVLEHQRRHTGDKPFKCDQCDRAFVHERLLRSHKTFRHPERPRLYTFACSKCDKKFSSRSALTTHSYTHNETVAFCKTCGRSFRFKTQFARHNQKQHRGTAELSRPVNVKEREKLESLESLGISAEVKPQLKCHVCWEPIQDKVFIQKHFDDHHPDHKGGLNTCQCGKKLNCYKHVMHHAMRHSRDRKEFQCDICPHKSFSLTELNVHRDSHVPVEERQKNHVCDVCGLGLVSANALHNHQKKHAEGRDKMKWICEQCGKSYTEKRGLDHHTKTAHLKILPWKCDKCDKSFPLKSILNKHNRCHLGYKPFKCDLCEVAFIHPTSKTRHMKEVHNVANHIKGRVRKTNKRRSMGGTSGDNDGREDDSVGSGSEQSSSFSGAVLPMPMNFSMYPPVPLSLPIPHPSHLISGAREGLEPELKPDRSLVAYNVDTGS